VIDIKDVVLLSTSVSNYCFVQLSLKSSRCRLLGLADWSPRTVVDIML
jgi:hypothetical protein